MDFTVVGIGTVGTFGAVLVEDVEDTTVVSVVDDDGIEFVLFEFIRLQNPPLLSTVVEDVSVDEEVVMVDEDTGGTVGGKDIDEVEETEEGTVLLALIRSQNPPPPPPPVLLLFPTDVVTEETVVVLVPRLFVLTLDDSIVNGTSSFTVVGIIRTDGGTGTIFSVEEEEEEGIVGIVIVMVPSVVAALLAFIRSQKLLPVLGSTESLLEVATDTLDELVMVKGTVVDGIIGTIGG